MLLRNPGFRHFRHGACQWLAALLLLSGCTAEEPRDGFNLRRYELREGPVQLTGVERNASGITYNWDDDSLYMVRNGPATLYRIDRQGKLLGSIDLADSGSADPEGIAYLGGGLFALAEERPGILRIVHIDAARGTVSQRAAYPLALPVKSANKGLEGVSYDPDSRTLYLVTERWPRRVLVVRGFEPEAGAPTLETLMDEEGLTLLEPRDLSAVHAFPGGRRYLLLSDESRLVEERGPDGQVLSELDLGMLNPDLFNAGGIAQAEGMVLTPDRTLYVVSEPDLLYIFRPGS